MVTSDTPINFWHLAFDDQFDPLFADISKESSIQVLSMIEKIVKMVTELDNNNILFCTLSFVKYFDNNNYRPKFESNNNYKELHVTLENISGK